MRRLIAQWQAKAEVTRMCRLLAISRSVVYAARLCGVNVGEILV